MKPAVEVRLVWVGVLLWKQRIWGWDEEEKGSDGDGCDWRRYFVDAEVLRRKLGVFGRCLLLYQVCIAT